MTATEPYIRLSGLKKVYKMGSATVHAVDGLTMEIAPGTLTVIMGPSGSGKSTLLYLLGGLDRPTEGEIVVDGQRIDALDENALARFRRKTVGFIFQSFNLIQSMNAQENVAFPMQFAGVGPRQRHQRATDALARVGLQERMLHRPAELSGGQQQRVAIARALVNDPGLILADEPTGNLDTSSGVSIMQLLSDLHQAGRTVVVVSHDPRMAHFATECIYLLDGQRVSEEEYKQAVLFAEQSAT
jgi:putative ABC transport system ATP-binding protein